MNSNRPLVSVVIPFYNTERYLAECIESVLRQTYDNWELLLVNNRSTDKSAEIAEHYVNLYPGKLRLEHNTDFLSQVQNYNRALQLISPKSKYCKLVQADDWIFPRCLAEMVDAAEQDPSIAVVGAYSLEGCDPAFGGLPYPSSVVDGNSVCRLFFLKNRYIFGSATQLLLRSDLVLGRTPFYDESYAPFEDTTVIFELLTRYKFGFVHQVLTFTRRDNDSVMMSLTVLDCNIAFELWMLRDFGHDFLQPDEYRECLNKREREYCQLLVQSMFRLRGRKFWEFHGPMLKRMGYTLRSAHVWRLLFPPICDAVFNPGTTLTDFVCGLRRLVGNWRFKRSAPSHPAREPRSLPQGAHRQNVS